MSPTPTMLGSVPFAPFDIASLPTPLASQVTAARERTTALLTPLPSRQRSVRADVTLSDHGRDLALRNDLRGVEVELRSAFDVARRSLKNSRGSAISAISGRLFGDIDRPGALSQAHAELLAFAARGDLSIPKIATDTNGRALLQSGTPLHRLLHATAERAPLDDARLAALAVFRASPFLVTLLGGEVVADAMVRTVESRAAETDPEVAALLSQRDAADLALTVLSGDEHTALAAAAKALGLPKDAIDRPDPIKEAAGRGR
ncbi:MAG: hypothetical protein JNM10_13355 [Planctomycetia bacterium]|nr:hypothetical protein [Planctomycetia bacterium]